MRLMLRDVFLLLKALETAEIGLKNMYFDKVSKILIYPTYLSITKRMRK